MAELGNEVSEFDIELLIRNIAINLVIESIGEDYDLFYETAKMIFDNLTKEQTRDVSYGMVLLALKNYQEETAKPVNLLDLKIIKEARESLVLQ